MAEFGVATPSVKVAGGKPTTATGKSLSVVVLRKTYGDVVAVDRDVHGDRRSLVYHPPVILMDEPLGALTSVIEQFDTPRELFERPRTHFVADLLGAANFLPGRVEKHTDEHTLVSGALAEVEPGCRGRFAKETVRCGCY